MRFKLDKAYKGLYFKLSVMLAIDSLRIVKMVVVTVVVIRRR